MPAMLNARERLSCIRRPFDGAQIARAAAAAAFAVCVPRFRRTLPAPLVPTALVEDVKSATADIEFMDYVGNGQVIKLEPGDVLVLSYLKSCEHETITGGTVMVGAEHSEVRDGQDRPGQGPLRRRQDAADLPAGEQERRQRVPAPECGHPSRTSTRAPPWSSFPRSWLAADRTLLIERTDRRGERHEIKIDDAIAAAGFYDLAKINVKLWPAARSMTRASAATR